MWVFRVLNTKIFKIFDRNALKFGLVLFQIFLRFGQIFL